MSERDGMSHEAAGRKGGKVSRKRITKLGQDVRRLNAAKRRAERAETEPVPAPLPPWLDGDKRGLPMRPPGKAG